MKKYKDTNSLNKISKDLYYEVSHLVELFLILTQEENNHLKKHAFLESLLIHARNIFYFLYNEFNDKWPDDVLVAHYLPNSQEWNQFKHSQLKKDIFVDFRKRIAKEIAHLSFDRLHKSDENKNWDIHFVIDLLEGIDKFIELVPGDLLHEDWKYYNTLKDKIYDNMDKLVFNQYVCSTH